YLVSIEIATTEKLAAIEVLRLAPDTRLAVGSRLDRDRPVSSAKVVFAVASDTNTHRSELPLDGRFCAWAVAKPAMSAPATAKRIKVFMKRLSQWIGTDIDFLGHKATLKRW